MMTTSYRDTASDLRPRRNRCKTGCVCCRLRKKKCDETRPVCLTCQRLGLSCSWPGANEFTWRINLGLTTSKRMSRKSKSGSVSTSSEDNSYAEGLELWAMHDSVMEPDYTILPSLPSEMAKLDTTSRRLLELFVRRTALQILGIPSAVRNPFLCDLVPIALSDRLVMNALLAVGGYPLLQVGEEEVIEKKRLQCYVDALRDLKTATAEWSLGRSRDPVRLLLATHLLCVHEVGDSLNLLSKSASTEHQPLTYQTGHSRECRWFTHAPSPRLSPLRARGHDGSTELLPSRPCWCGTGILCLL